MRPKTSHTVAPLKLAAYPGFFIALAVLRYGASAVVRTIPFGNAVPGHPSLMAVLLFLEGVQPITSSVAGEAVGRFFNDAKASPETASERLSEVAGLGGGYRSTSREALTTR